MIHSISSFPAASLAAIDGHRANMANLHSPFDYGFHLII
jgi:hypothetical protein